MDRQTLHHGYLTGHHLGLCLALALGFVLGTQVATATECQRETPLPADVRLVAPGPHVPEAIAGFAGVWSTAWDNPDGLCHTLVVEEVFANGLARVIYSHGTSVALDIPLPGFLHTTGRIVDGILRFRLPAGDRPELVYWFADGTLQRTYKGERRSGLTRVPDGRQGGCGASAGGPPRRHPLQDHAIG